MMLQGHLQVRGVVLETQGSVSLSNTNIATYDSTRAVYDDRKHAVRYALGDLSMGGTPLRDPQQILGIGASRNFGIHPYTTYQHLGRFRFFLEEPSVVNVYVNRVLIDTLRLPAGPHDIRDYPLVRGGNRIELEILGASGRSEKVDFSTAQSQHTLRAGTHAYNYGIGLAQNRDTKGYEFENPLVSAHHRYAVTDTFLLSSYGTAGLSRQMAVAGFSLATLGGNISLDGGAEHTQGETVTPAGRLVYQLARARGTGELVNDFEFGVTYRPSSFGRYRDIGL